MTAVHMRDDVGCSDRCALLRDSNVRDVGSRRLCTVSAAHAEWLDSAS